MEGLCPEGHLLYGDWWDGECCCAGVPRECCPSVDEHQRPDVPVPLPPHTPPTQGSVVAEVSA